MRKHGACLCGHLFVAVGGRKSCSWCTTENDFLESDFLENDFLENDFLVFLSSLDILLRCQCTLDYKSVHEHASGSIEASGSKY